MAMCCVIFIIDVIPTELHFVYLVVFIPIFSFIIYLFIY